jgi:hypothetical protein
MVPNIKHISSEFRELALTFIECDHLPLSFFSQVSCDKDSNAFVMDHEG